MRTNRKANALQTAFNYYHINYLGLRNAFDDGKLTSKEYCVAINRVFFKWNSRVKKIGRAALPNS